MPPDGAPSASRSRIGVRLMQALQRVWRVRFRSTMDSVRIGLGLHRSAARVDKRAVRRFVFICKGNVCRSPYVAAAARGQGFPAVSAGLDVQVSMPAEPIAVQVAAGRGVDLRGHVSTSLNDISLRPGDCLVAMDPDQYHQLRTSHLHRNVQITMLGIWRHPPFLRVPDPYGGEEEQFEMVYGLIDEALPALLNGTAADPARQRPTRT